MVVGLNSPMTGNFRHPPPSSSLVVDGSDCDGKRLRKSMMRKTVDYNSSFLNMLQNRIWQRDHRDRRAIQPDITYYPEIIPPQQLKNNPVNAVTTRFVKTASNKMRCPIFCLTWTPEGRRLITGASSGEFTLWNGLVFNFETILQAHDSPVRTMLWSHNDNWMVTGDHGGYIKYWQSNMNNVKMFQAHKEPIRKVSFSPTDVKFASCSDDGTVRIWDFQRCEEERVLRGHGADVKCCDWHPQKSIVVSGSKDNQQPIKLWCPKTGQVLSTIHAHKNTVMDVQWNKNGNWLVTASRDHLLKLFDIRNLKEEMQTFRGHKKEASAVSWHPIHEGMFASGGSDGSVMFWNVGAEKEIGAIEQAHESIVWCLAWHPVGHILTTGSNDHTVKFWSRNRPGDPMRDKFNLNTLPPGQEEDYGNIGDLVEKATQQQAAVQGVTQIPGMAPEDRVEGSDSSTIPGLDFEPAKEEKKKLPFAKPISREFLSHWNVSQAPTNAPPPILPVPGMPPPTAQPPSTGQLPPAMQPPPAITPILEPDRGVKRTFGEREASGMMHNMMAPPVNSLPPHGAPLPGMDPLRKDVGPPFHGGHGTANAISLAQLQQEATAIVAKGQIIPVLPGTPLFLAIPSGESAIKEALAREFSVEEGRMGVGGLFGMAGGRPPSQQRDMPGVGPGPNSGAGGYGGNPSSYGRPDSGNNYGGGGGGHYPSDGNNYRDHPGNYREETGGYRDSGGNNYGGSYREQDSGGYRDHQQSGGVGGGYRDQGGNNNYSGNYGGSSYGGGQEGGSTGGGPGGGNFWGGANNRNKHNNWGHPNRGGRMGT